MNRLISETDQQNATVNYTLDGQGQVTTYADPRNLQTVYSRNGFGEVKRRASPDSGNTDTVYDARGLATQITDGRGIVTSMTYDAAGRILTKTYPAAVAENVAYTYDDVTAGNKGKGRLTRIASQNVTIDRVYDVRGNIVTDKRTIAGKIYTTAYVYNVADQVTQVTYPSGRIVTYLRSATTGRIVGVTTKQNAAAAVVNLLNAVSTLPHSTIPWSLTYGNGLTESNTFTADYALTRRRVLNGTVALIDRTLARGDLLNLTGITDAVTPAKTETFAYSAANRLTNAAATGAGAYGTRVWGYDAVGNRTSEVSTPVGGAATTRTFTYPATSNKPTNVMIGAVTDRAFVHDAGGNLISDTRSGVIHLYTYNNRNRMSTATVGGVLKGTYTYNGLEQLAIRATTNMTPSGTTHFIHDLAGNVIAETAGGGATGATGTVREYIWLPEGEITPTFGSRAQVDRPLAVVNAVNTTPVTWYVHVDHLNRPIKMTDAAKASVWDAVWQAFSARRFTVSRRCSTDRRRRAVGSRSPSGQARGQAGTAVLDARFPGQWFQLETGLHYNWNRTYDPTLGRYTQPDPLGFVDGPSIYGYARGNPQSLVDPDGQVAQVCGVFPGACAAAAAAGVQIVRKAVRMCVTAVARGFSQSEPPGDCTPEQHRDLQDRVDNACLRPARCLGSESNMSVLTGNIGRHSQCIDARRQMNNTCFRGGNATHNQAIAERVEAIATCNRFITRLGGK